MRERLRKELSINPTYDFGIATRADGELSYGPLTQPPDLNMPLMFSAILDIPEMVCFIGDGRVV